jgi:nucleotide-binding universal stress UspA family protein
VDPEPAFHGEVIDRRQPEYQQRLREMINAIKPSDPGSAIERLLSEGKPGEEIVAFAKERNCDLIVMGTHGRTGLERALLGSVAEQVVRAAPCPVLTLRLPSKGGLLA